MKTTMLHPTLEAVLAIQAEVSATHGGSQALRSRDLLEAAVAAPQAAAMAGGARMTDPIEIAAAYLFYLGRNDAFVGGSKAAALATCLVFLSDNGLLKSEILDANDWEKLTLDVAAGVISRDEATQRLRGLVS